MSPDEKMHCNHCKTIRQVREILYLSNGGFEVVCAACGEAQRYGTPR
jgi:RNase P subunit RPR2